MGQRLTAFDNKFVKLKYERQSWLGLIEQVPGVSQRIFRRSANIRRAGSPVNALPGESAVHESCSVAEIRRQLCDGSGESKMNTYIWRAVQHGLGSVMNIRQINDEYAVSGQISVEDLAQIKSMGFKSIVCHRPDGESPEQPAYADIADKAKELGLEIRYIPVGHAGVGYEKVKEFVDALDEMDRPMLGYCRSGARSTAIYQQTLHIRS